MIIELYHKRKPTVKDTTFSQLFGPGLDAPICWLLEDAVREVEGVPVEQWKIPGKTAIPSGRYRVALVDSPRFGPDTITLLDVPGFTVIRVHAGNDDEDTEGCPLTGTTPIYDANGDGGNVAESRKALGILKDYLVPLLKTPGNEIYWNVVNA